MSARNVDLNLYGEFVNELISAAVDAYEVLDQYADADQPPGSPAIPNDAMRVQMDLKSILGQLRAIPIQRGQASRGKLIEYVKTGGHSGATNWFVQMKPEDLTDDQLRVIADGMARDLRRGEQINRRNREMFRQRSAS